MRFRWLFDASENPYALLGVVVEHTALQCGIRLGSFDCSSNVGRVEDHFQRGLIGPSHRLTGLEPTQARLK